MVFLKHASTSARPIRVLTCGLLIIYSCDANMIHSSRTLSVLVDDVYFENHFPHRSVSDTKKHTLLFAYDQNYL